MHFEDYEQTLVEYAVARSSVRKLLQYMKKRKSASVEQIGSALEPDKEQLESDLIILMEYDVVVRIEDKLKGPYYGLTTLGHQFATSFLKDRR